MYPAFIINKTVIRVYFLKILENLDISSSLPLRTELILGTA